MIRQCAHCDRPLTPVKLGMMSGDGVIIVKETYWCGLCEDTCDVKTEVQCERSVNTLREFVNELRSTFAAVEVENDWG